MAVGMCAALLAHSAYAELRLSFQAEVTGVYDPSGLIGSTIQVGDVAIAGFGVDADEMSVWWRDEAGIGGGASFPVAARSTLSVGSLHLIAHSSTVSALQFESLGGNQQRLSADGYLDIFTHPIVPWWFAQYRAPANTIDFDTLAERPEVAFLPEYAALWSLDLYFVVRRDEPWGGYSISDRDPLVHVTTQLTGMQFQRSGAPAAVPEPSTYALGAGVLVAGLILRHRASRHARPA